MKIIGITMDGCYVFNDPGRVPSIYAEGRHGDREIIREPTDGDPNGMLEDGTPYVLFTDDGWREITWPSG